MFARKLVPCLSALVLTLGWTATTSSQERRGPAPFISGIFKSADASAGTITITTMPFSDARREGGERGTKDMAYTLAKNVEVAVGTGYFSNTGRGAGILFREARLTDFSAGCRVTLTLTADEKTVESIVGEGPMVRGQLKAVDAGKNTLTLQLPPQGGRERAEAPAAGEEKIYPLAPDVEVAIDDGRGSRFSLKEGKLADLANGAIVTARLTLNQKQIQSVTAEGMSYQGIIKALDPAKKTLSLMVRPPRGDDAGEEHQLLTATDTLVMLDDGKGRRLSLKEAKLADVPVGAAATVKLSVDQNFVMQLRVEGPTLIGQLKSVDADKGYITIAMFKNRGEDPEEKTLAVAKDARVNIDGTDSRLADLKVGDNPSFIQLRLSLDQKTVQGVMARGPGGR